MIVSALIIITVALIFNLNLNR